MKCKATVAIPLMTINGKRYREGDFWANTVLSEQEFKTLNGNPQITGLKYEEIKEDERDYEKVSMEIDEKNKRIALETKANGLNIQFRSTIGDDKLLDKINEVEPEFKL